MTRLTKAAALREAVRRWGPGGAVSYQPNRPTRATIAAADARGHYATHEGSRPVKDCPECVELRHLVLGGLRCRVGRILMGMFFSLEGEGDTWEEAFADVDARRAKEEAHRRELLGIRQTDAGGWACVVCQRPVTRDGCTRPACKGTLTRRRRKARAGEVR